MFALDYSVVVLGYGGRSGSEGEERCSVLRFENRSSRVVH